MGRVFDPSYRQLQVLLFAAVAIAVLAGTLLFSQPDPEPREDQETNVSQGNCESCHSSFVPLTLEVDLEAQGGLAHTLKARVENPKEHQVRSLRAQVMGLANTSQPPETGSVEGTVYPTSSDEYPLQVQANASWLEVRLDGDEGFTGANDIDLTLTGPAGGSWTSDDSGPHEIITLNSATLAREGPGEYTLQVEWFAGEGGVDYELGWKVDYAKAELVQIGPDLMEDESHTFVWQLNLTPAQAQRVGVQVSLTAHHDHDGEGVDNGDYTLSLESGLSSPPANPRRWKLGLGQALGLTMFGMIVVGVATGLAASSRLPWPKWVVRSELGEKSRGHTLAGLLLLWLALPHAFSLQTGPYASTTTGLVTGSATLATLAGLTYLTLDRKRLARRWGWPRWQWVHRATVIGFLLLAVYHIGRVASHLPP